MKRLFKKSGLFFLIAASIAIIASSLFAAGCGSGGPTGGPTGPTGPIGPIGPGYEEDPSYIHPAWAPKTQINFWSIFPNGDFRNPGLLSLLDQFEQENPEFTVKHDGTEFWSYFGKLTVAQSGQTDPDLAMNDNITTFIRAKSGIIQPIEDLLDASEVIARDDFSQTDLDAYTYYERLYALPLTSDYRLLYYNKDQLRAAAANATVIKATHLTDQQLKDKMAAALPPETFEELYDYGAALDIIQNKGSPSEKLTRVGYHPDLGNNTWNTNIFSMGARVFDANGDAQLYTANTESGARRTNANKLQAGIQQYQDLYRRYVKGTNDNSLINGWLSEANESMVNHFITQKASITVDGNWLVWEIDDMIKKGAYPDFDWGVAPYPYKCYVSGNLFTGERSSVAGGFSYEISMRSKNLEKTGTGGVYTERKRTGAYKLMEFLLSPGVQAQFPELMLFTPTNRVARDELLDNPDGAYDAKTLQNIADVFAEEPYKVMTELCEALPGWWANVQPYIDAIKSGASVTTQMENAQNEVQGKIYQWKQLN